MEKTKQYTSSHAAKHNMNVEREGGAWPLERKFPDVQRNISSSARGFFFFCPSKSQYIISAGDTPSFQAFTMLDAFYRAEQEGERKTFLRPTCLEKPASELMDVTAGNGLVCV
ncbi:Uncharacterized protein APZ42_020679 [Daphnia magna]|uniref:Uncharacterized protein n=1 Tax=Daphnia magna TaxID=35525 RepID=A0A164XB98_9CRUS|nr:Uncharacterized protein APZ42_020679 [Daphnia magna]